MANEIEQSVKTVKAYGEHKDSFNASVEVINELTRIEYGKGTQHDKAAQEAMYLADVMKLGLPGLQIVEKGEEIYAKSPDAIKSPSISFTALSKEHPSSNWHQITLPELSLNYDEVNNKYSNGALRGHNTDNVTGTDQTSPGSDVKKGNVAGTRPPEGTAEVPPPAPDVTEVPNYKWKGTGYVPFDGQNVKVDFSNIQDREDIAGKPYKGVIDPRLSGRLREVGGVFQKTATGGQIVLTEESVTGITNAVPINPPIIVPLTQYQDGTIKSYGKSHVNY
jgi:hypothetical protein